MARRKEALADYTVAEIAKQTSLMEAMSPSPSTATVYACVSSAKARVTFEPYGYRFSTERDDRRKITCRGEGKTWREAFANCRTDYEAKVGDVFRETVKRMALSIITVTVDTGSCTHAALRGSGFTQQEINDAGSAAVALANTYADAGPFAILVTAGNGEPVDDEAEAA